MSLEPSKETSSGTNQQNPVFVNPFGAGLTGIQVGLKKDVDTDANSGKTTGINTSNKTSSAIIQNQIHIEIKSRNARKSITFVKGLSESIPSDTLDDIAKKWKKSFSCSVVNDNGIIKISGDRREDAADYLVNKGIVDKSLIRIHGF